MEAGALFKPCFCGPCFGAGDVPANNALSIRHTTRNFPNREGSKPGNGQLAGVILMDARSIAATARNHGVLTSAADVSYDAPKPVARTFDADVYKKRVYFGVGKPQPEHALKFGPNITEWPKNSGALGKPSHAGGLRPARPCDHDGRADPLGRNIVVPLEPSEACNLCPLPPGPRVCRPRKRDA